MTDEFDSYSYTSAPPTNDILYLPLSSPFDTSSVPWQLINGSANTTTSQGPAVAWHTISYSNSTTILLFGGEFGPNAPTVLPDIADSSYLLSVENILAPTWITEPVSWANEPIRRMRQSAVSINEKIFLIGGQKADGSGEAFSDHYVVDISVPSFTLLPSSNGPPDLYGHVSVVLNNGLLAVFGGYCGSQAALLPLTTIWTMNTTQSTLQWSLLSVDNSSIPPPRMAFAAAVVSDGKIIIHGGADALLQTTYSDGWMLDTTLSPAVWSSVTILSQLGPRRDHFAIAAGSQVIFGFGERHLYGFFECLALTPIKVMQLALPPLLLCKYLTALAVNGFRPSLLHPRHRQTTYRRRRLPGMGKETLRRHQLQDLDLQITTMQAILWPSPSARQLACWGLLLAVSLLYTLRGGAEAVAISGSANLGRNLPMFSEMKVEVRRRTALFRPLVHLGDDRCGLGGYVDCRSWNQAPEEEPELLMEGEICWRMRIPDTFRCDRIMG
jgi:hypothetical protein